MRKALLQIVDTLSKRPERELPLDLVSETIGAMSITSEEIGLILDALEAGGKTITESESTAKQSLMVVVGSARALKKTLGRQPTSREIAEHSGLSLEAVRLGLLFASMLQR